MKKILMLFKDNDNLQKTFNHLNKYTNKNIINKVSYSQEKYKFITKESNIIEGIIFNETCFKGYRADNIYIDSELFLTKDELNIIYPMLLNNSELQEQIKYYNASEYDSIGIEFLLEFLDAKKKNINNVMTVADLEKVLKKIPDKTLPVAWYNHEYRNYCFVENVEQLTYFQKENPYEETEKSVMNLLYLN